MYEPDGVHLPDQGWKIYASATMDECEQTIGIVWDYCVAHRVPFKFLRGRRAALTTNSKHTPRGASGKLLTIYPSDDAMLADTLTGLAPLLRSRKGPYILGDLRYEDGPLYVRYGAFSEMYCPDENGEPAYGLRTPGGRIVSRLTARPAWSSRTASTARWRGSPIGTGLPAARTSTGPRARNSTSGPARVPSDGGHDDQDSLDPDGDRTRMHRRFNDHGRWPHAPLTLARSWSFWACRAACRAKTP